MDKYIKYVDVFKVFQQLLQVPREQHKDEDWHTGVYDAMGEVDRIPVVVIEEPKIGKWEFKKYAGQEYYKCSCCGKDYPLPPAWNAYDVNKYLKYCSCCGAKMAEANNKEIY